MDPMEPTDNWWYSPQIMLVFADRAMGPYAAEGIEPPGELRKAVDEGRTGALFALGLAKFFGAETWMRLVDPSEQAPDIRIMYLEGSGPKGSNLLREMKVEVTTYTKHSTEPLGDFLFRVKLNPTKKAYSSTTAIVAFVQRAITPEEVRAATPRLEVLGARGLCYVVGRLDQTRFQVVRVFPTFSGPQTIDLDEEFQSNRLAVVELKRGMSSVTKVTEDPISTDNPFLS